MAAKLIDGKAIAARVRAEVAEEVAAFTERTRPRARARDGARRRRPRLGRLRRRQAARLGRGRDGPVRPAPAGGRQPPSRSEAELEALNEDPAVNGILLQLPVPDHLDGRALTALVGPRRTSTG